QIQTKKNMDVSGYAKHARTLYDVLAPYTQCSCTIPGKDETDRHRARLRLKPVYELGHGGCVPFNMIFSILPNPLRSQDYQWQDTQILLPTTIKEVHWEESQRQQSLPEDLDSEQVESLCEVLAGNCGTTLSFFAEKDRLRVLYDPVGLKHRRGLHPSSGLHLGQILDRFDMRHGMRVVLAYTLAKAVWYYYDSEWMTLSIGNRNANFMAEAADDGTAYFCKPYLCADFTPIDNKTPEYRPVVGLRHRYPRVFALGIMLFEIAIGRQLDVQGRPDDWTPRQGMISSRFCCFRDDCEYPWYKLAVKNCLDPGLFRDAPYNTKKGQKPSENLARRRAILHDQVVSPLRRLVEGTGWNTEFQEIEDTALTPKGRTTILSASDLHDILPTKSTNEDITPSPILKRQRDEWVDQTTKLNRILQKEPTKRLRISPVRIAVLDTGYDDSVPTFDEPNRPKRIKKWRDFVSHGSTTQCPGTSTHL
ncbi:hypothetical protein QBC35DRAFT_349749, partial [Podospora australis]